MEHILSLSYGKDSLACLFAIEKLGGGDCLRNCLSNIKRNGTKSRKALPKVKLMMLMLATAEN